MARIQKTFPLRNIPPLEWVLAFVALGLVTFWGVLGLLHGRFDVPIELVLIVAAGAVVFTFAISLLLRRHSRSHPIPSLVYPRAAEWPATEHADFSPANLVQREWSSSYLASFDARQLTQVCVRCFNDQGYSSHSVTTPDSSLLELRLFRPGDVGTHAIVLCMANEGGVVEENIVLRAHSRKVREQLYRAVCVTNGSFSDRARQCASENFVHLIDLQQLMYMVQKLPVEDRQALLAVLD